ncbi:MAG: DUF983 domain-containing protein [Sphingobacteriales bacterium]|nr:MAG: DUF983 domain-containing protein [Sphingobacteriales bacterium]
MDTKRITALNILKCKCPRCHEGKLFKYPLTWNINRMMQMHRNCEICDLEFTPEAGYYYGAMYVSYAFITAELITTLAILYALFGALSMAVIMAVVTVVFLLLSPVNFRLGRSGWIAIFYRYDEKYSQKLQREHK